MGYTNSSLVKHTYLSPNYYNGRNGITGVTVHCVVGHGTWQGVGEWFSRPSTNASCNYFVDDNGDVTLIVPEKNGSWCTSSYSNDMSKITIEVASDGTTPYAFTEKAYLGVVKLVADIYKRNGIKKATWNADKNHPGNISVHRWFKNKECPGNWFYGKLQSGDFCKRVNEILDGGSEVETATQKPGTPVNNEGLKYKAHCQSIGWCDEVHDGQTAGTVGYGKRLEALNVKMPGDAKLKVKAHVQREGWKQYEGNEVLIGTTGKSLRLEAVEMHAEGLPEGKKLMYQVHVQGIGWMDWTDDGYPTGTMNQSKRIEAIRMKIVEE